MSNHNAAPVEQQYSNQPPVAEQLLDRETINQQAYGEALESFAMTRGLNLDPNSQDPYILVSKGADSMYANYNLLEDLQPSYEGEQAEKPAFTICVPVAITKEDPDTLVNTVRLIHDAQKKFEKPVEVILWDNARYEGESARPTTEQDAQIRHDELRTRLQKEDLGGLQIRTALQVLPKKEATMSKLRSNYMDAVAVEGYEKGYGFDHPVMWLDADTTFIGRDLFRNITEHVQKFDHLFTHPVVNYTSEWLPKKNLAELDNTDRALLIHEIARRASIRESGAGMNDRSDEYYEESGLAFALGTYLRAGGVDTADPVNESARLVQNARVIHGAAQTALKQAVKRGLPTTQISSLIPQELASPNLLNNDAAVYDPNSRIGLSGRRHYEAVRLRGEDALHDFNGSLTGDKYQGYQLFTDMDMAGEAGEAHPISRMMLKGEIEKEMMKGRTYSENEDLTRREKMTAKLFELIDKHIEGPDPLGDAKEARDREWEEEKRRREAEWEQWEAEQARKSSAA